jgi:hypothetical protein
VARPARREEHGQPDVLEPLWFRICQFRLPSYPVWTLVQRMVMVNSFAFTILIAPVGADWPCPEFDKWSKVFTDGYPDAKLVLPGACNLTVTAGRDHAAASLAFTYSNHPVRFLEEDNPYIVPALIDDLKVVMVRVPYELIEANDTAPIASMLRDMVFTREAATAFKQRIGLMVDGFNDDPREIWEFPNARQFFRRLLLECPFVMWLAHPGGSLLKLLFACWVYENDLSDSVEKQRISEFLKRCFDGLNKMTYSLMISEEQNREICMSAGKVLFNEVPPI